MMGKHQLSKIENFVLNCNVHLSSTVKYLGAIFDENLSFDKHILSVCKKSYFQLHKLYQLRKF